MISYASIDSIKHDFVTCEIEKIPIQDSSTSDFANKDCYFTDIDIDDIFFNVEEGDILIVQHNCKEVSKVVGKDDIEKARRKALLKKIMKK